MSKNTTVYDLPAAQGDVLVFRVEKLPEGATEVPRVNGQLIVTESETHHHHAISNDGVMLFAHPTNPLIGYVKVTAKAPYADIVHHRSWDTHETLRLLRGEADDEAIYEVRRQREHTPEGWAKVHD